MNVDGCNVAIVIMFLRMWVNGSLTGVNQYSKGLDFAILLFWEIKFGEDRRFIESCWTLYITKF